MEVCLRSKLAWEVYQYQTYHFCHPYYLQQPLRNEYPEQRNHHQSSQVFLVAGQPFENRGHLKHYHLKISELTPVEQSIVKHIIFLVYD